MSKSEKVFFLVMDILQEFSAEEVRFYLLSTHYRSPIEFSRERLGEARVALERIRQAIERYGGFDRDGGGASGEMAETIERIEREFHESMEDDFNTAKGLGHLFELARAANRVGESGDESSARAAAQVIVRLGSTVGLFQEGPAEEESWPAEVLERVAQREEARKSRDWATADRLRDELLEMGVVVEDRAEGPELKRKSSSTASETTR